MLKAMYRGKLPIANMEINCAVLDNEIRILSATSVFEAFGRSRRGLSKERNREVLDILTKNIPNHGWHQIPPFLASKGLISLVDIEFLNVLQPIQYYDGDNLMQGYKAELLPQLCNLYLKARRDGFLNSQQKKIAEKSEILLGALANVGIVALIDEAVGYQYNRKHDALRILLQQYIAEGIQKWLKRFPDKFFEGLDKLYENEKTTSRNRPMYYGGFINKYVYEPLENGFIKAELNQLNITDEGKRKARFHQWLTDFGNNQLQMQIGRVSGIIEISSTLDEFKKFIAKQSGLAIQDDLFTAEEIVNIKKIYKKQQNKEHLETIEVDTKNIVKEIQKDNLEFKNNSNFEPILNKIANTKKPE